MTIRTPEPLRSIVTLTTDFGPSDAYVAAMKGVLLSINPVLSIVDVTHDVLPGRVVQAVFLTQCALPFFPTGTIHVVVVDPGVGTERRGIALETPRGYFVGPDNGVLSSALPDAARPGLGEPPGLVVLPEGYRAVSVTNRRYMREPVSATFHGRDVFAPAAAHLAACVPIDDFGERVDSIIVFPPLRSVRDSDGILSGQVLHIDRFGNVITDIRATDLPAGALVVEIGGHVVHGPVRTYASAPGLAAIVGSSGYLEVALPNGSAALALNVNIGAVAVLRRTG